MRSNSILYFSFCLWLAAEGVVGQADAECTYCGKPVLSSNLEARTLLTNVNKKGSAVERWTPPDDSDICVIVVEGESLSITGRVCLFRDNEVHEDKCIDIDVTLSGFAPIDDCYCSSELSPFVDEFADPNYEKMQKKCDYKAFNKRPSDASELLFCPACKADTCSDAKKMQSTNGAPDPIYLNWNFYTEINGSLSGSGMDVFREPVLNKVPGAPEGLTSCTPDISDLLLPQMYCSDPEDPVNGYGYGANSHSQKCGLGFWFNCKEDLPYLTEGKHCLDINMAFEPCPSQPPTGFNPPATTPPFTIPCIPEVPVCDVWAVPILPNDKDQSAALTTLNKRGIESRWLPPSKYLCLNYEDENVHITGEVCLSRGKSVDEDICLDIDITLSGHKTIDDCYCSSELAPWVDDFENPSYKKVQKKCTMEAYNERDIDAQALLPCPACKRDTCNIARRKQHKNGAPNPIYKDWDFYTDVSGSISGSGMNKLLKKIQKCIPDVPLDITTCTPVVDNLLLPQMYCSDYSIPENGYGYGVNAIDQECGLSFWFNCQEFLPYLEDVSHCLDLNLNFQTCPPTCAPTSSPV
mmetsp:Transcript_7974/g.10418  ORF Transcript_7974/g.10418 Transcript_7974/m.10418 type:complete len:579 (+) Transcript_7974:378-2114(+)|eukprot:CAMPEP_0204863510 /NCGR_PEP_ID=MMETSP1348-20121228/3360_1 /ASSEMBLY_ACC=CAM_ASM_000700 /TAXON_ID=215587 /ORGANISM="Aplanochytrium stocchinoi, Strain GSBS06" /LENGTH=578 /DNA_ID=CAMNT_0052013849 /DNA_START=310 /DNA_END=2046 /DNA_ORIENTATION=-